MVSIVPTDEERTNHPELQEGERLLMFGNQEAYDTLKWSTKRQGLERDDGLFPVFVLDDELDNPLSYPNGLAQKLVRNW